MEREACVCDHGYERSDLCAEIIIIITRRKALPRNNTTPSCDTKKVLCVIPFAKQSIVL